MDPINNYTVVKYKIGNAALVLGYTFGLTAASGSAANSCDSSYYLRNVLKYRVKGAINWIDTKDDWYNHH
jgi:hypothetical protein